MLAETVTADSAAADKVKVVAEEVAGEALLCTERVVECSAVIAICPEADNGSDDIRTVEDECGVPGG
jgi:hypothetical protein